MWILLYGIHQTSLPLGSLDRYQYALPKEWLHCAKRVLGEPNWAASSLVIGKHLFRSWIIHAR